MQQRKAEDPHILEAVVEDNVWCFYLTNDNVINFVEQLID